MVAAEGDQRSRVDGFTTFVQYNRRCDAFAPLAVGQAERRSLLDGGMTGQHILDLARVDVGTAADDRVMAPVEQTKLAASVDEADVAGAQEPVDESGRIRQIVSPVALHHDVSAHADLAGLALWNLGAFRVEDADF